MQSIWFLLNHKLSVEKINNLWNQVFYWKKGFRHRCQVTMSSILKNSTILHILWMDGCFIFHLSAAKFWRCHCGGGRECMRGGKIMLKQPQWCSMKWQLWFVDEPATQKKTVISVSLIKRHSTLKCLLIVVGLCYSRKNERIRKTKTKSFECFTHAKHPRAQQKNNH